MYRLISAKADVECVSCGRAIKKDEVSWWIPGEYCCTKCEPSWSDEYVQRATLRRAKKADLIKLAFAKGYHTAHGERTKVYYADKKALIDLIMSGKDTGVELGGETKTGEHVSFDEEAIQRVVEAALNTYAARQDKRLPQLVAEELAKLRPNTIEVKRVDGKKVKMGLQHKQFGTLLDYVSCRLNVYMVGPAGSGKTRAAREVAKALKLDFFAESVSQQTPVHKLMGYKDATGNYQTTSFRKAFENGGIFLLDEMDNGNPNVLAAFNAAVAAEAGETVSFPDGMIAKHEDFVCVAAANTFGRGGDREYVGRNPLDAATLDRFVIIEWDYDEALEMAICEKQGLDTKWVEHVQKCRRAADELKIRLVISPRASFHGGSLLKVGRSWEEAESSVVFKGLDKDSVDKIKARVRSGA